MNTLSSKEEKIKVIELFAGVGGFRIGLEGWNGKSSCSKFKDKLKSNYEVVWSNQWEPSTKVQHASSVYENRWGVNNHSNEDNIFQAIKVGKNCGEFDPHRNMCQGNILVLIGNYANSVVVVSLGSVHKC